MSNGRSPEVVVNINDLEDPAYFRGIDAGEQLERERILSLFDARRNQYVDAEKFATKEGDETAIYYEMQIKLIADLIALIEGGQK
jgi:hypothetical protein